MTLTNTKTKNKIKQSYLTQKGRVGILGGMGPMAGVHIQKRIIELTPATKDQDHLEVICYTNPSVPNRGTSLAKDNGETFVTAVEASLKVLEAAGATFAIIACNTCHAYFDRFQKATSMRLISLVESAVGHVKELEPQGNILVLSTYAARKEKIYENVFAKEGLKVTELTEAEAIEVDAVVYGIKSQMIKLDQAALKLAEIIKPYLSSVTALVLGCTELSMLPKNIVIEQMNLYSVKGVTIYDPIDIVAEKLVANHKL